MGHSYSIWRLWRAGTCGHAPYCRLSQCTGCNVIVDDLLFKRAYLDDYVDVLNAETTWFIGVKCRLDVVHEREALRPGRFPELRYPTLIKFMLMGSHTT